jgi:hypothetical protein
VGVASFQLTGSAAFGSNGPTVASHAHTNQQAQDAQDLVVDLPSPIAEREQRRNAQTVAVGEPAD